MVHIWNARVARVVTSSVRNIGILLLLLYLLLSFGPNKERIQTVHLFCCESFGLRELCAIGVLDSKSLGFVRRVDDLDVIPLYPI